MEDSAFSDEFCRFIRAPVTSVGFDLIAAILHKNLPATRRAGPLRERTR